MKPELPVVGDNYVMYEYNPTKNRFYLRTLMYCSRLNTDYTFKDLKYNEFNTYDIIVYQNWMQPIDMKEEAFISILNKFIPSIYNSRIKDKYPEYFI